MSCCNYKINTILTMTKNNSKSFKIKRKDKCRRKRIPKHSTLTEVKASHEILMI